MKKVMVAALVAALPAALSAQAPAGPGPAPSGLSVAEAVAGISAEDFERRVGVIAHDSMRGRDTPSPELELTAEWIAAQFRRFGLEPGGDGGSFLQRYPIPMLAFDFQGSSVRATPGGALAFGDDVLPAGPGTPTPGSGEGPVVTVRGAVEPAQARGWELAGRQVILFLPAEVARDGRALARQIQIYRAEEVAGIVLASDASDADWEARAAALRDATFMDRRRPPGILPPVVEARDEGLARVLGIDVAELRAATGPPARSVVPDVTLSLTVGVRSIEESAPNVVGILRGGDPALADEYVVFSAHMDHVGVGRPDETGDSIFNGADDDASGTVAVVEVAEAMASLEARPRRSMIFLLVSGEEKGLWGSARFADDPPVPVESLVANLNADMVGRNWTDTIVAIGREHSDLGETLARVNARHPELGMSAIDDPWPEERFYFRSDHYNFARRGVPILFFFNGTHEDYHRPSDEPEKIDAEKSARIARLVFYLGMEVGDADARPAWDPESYRQIVGGGR